MKAFDRNDIVHLICTAYEIDINAITPQMRRAFKKSCGKFTNSLQGIFGRKFLKKAEKRAKYDNLPHGERLEAYANGMRVNPTKAESKLKEILVSLFSDGEFSHQFVVGSCILDFYVHACRLCIEVDGDYHYTQEQKKKDHHRTIYLNSQGIHVIRFDNTDILNADPAIIEKQIVNEVLVRTAELRNKEPKALAAKTFENGQTVMVVSPK